MAWYRAGTVTVTNGSTAVTGANTDFVANTQQGEAFLGPDGRVYEVAQVVSATQIVLGMNYQGGSAGAQGYALMPTSSFARDLALGAAQLLNTFATVRDGAGSGMFPDGSLATPGIRFAADQDTGFCRLGADSIGIVVGGVLRGRMDGNAFSIGSGGTVPNTTQLVLNGTSAPGQGAAVVITRNGSASGFIGNAGAALGGTESSDLVYYAYGSDAHRFYAGGTERMRVAANGLVGIGNDVTAPTALLTLSGPTGDTCGIHINRGGWASKIRFGAVGTSGDEFWLSHNYRPGVGVDTPTLGAGYVAVSGGVVRIGTAQNGAVPVDRVSVDVAGNLLVGTTSGNAHTFSKGGAEGAVILQVDNVSTFASIIYAVGAFSASTTATGMRIGQNTSTGRSINAGGTINANGADYAEYMTKAPGCGNVSKGDVCGVDRQGRITRSWAEAIMFKLKSTDPNLVGGDAWAAHLGARPVEPALVRPPYAGPSEPTEPADDDASDDYNRALAAYEAARGTYAGEVAAAEAAHQAALIQYEADLATFDADLETARQTVDRIAYCGRVPVNFADACKPGDYLVAIANGGGIGLKAVAEADITFADYRRRVGRILSIGEDNRPIVDVMQG